MIFDEHGM